MRSIVSCTLRRPPKSQFGPVKSGVAGAMSDFVFDLRVVVASVSGTDAPFGEEFVEDREDLRRIADPPHREMLMCWRDLAVGTPQIAIARQTREAAAGAVADLDIGEILAEWQHLAAEQRDAAARVRAVIVAVRGLRAVDVPAIGRVARASDLQHLVERGRNDGAAGLPTVEERFLVNFLSGRGVADEHHIDMPV